MKRITLFLAILLLLNGFNLFAQQFWMQHGGSADVDEGIGVSSDAAGNTYSTGYFSSVATFGITVLNSYGITDIFLADRKSVV